MSRDGEEIVISLREIGKEFKVLINNILIWDISGTKVYKQTIEF